MSNAGPLTPAKLAAMQRALMYADDQEVLLALQYVDTLSARGPADALIAPLRERLTKLRPPRPWRMPRLLFTPMNAVLVSHASWRPGSPRLPRSAIPPLAGAVRAALPEPCATAEAMLAKAGKPSPEGIAAAGGLIWPYAGDVLRAAAMPADWCKQGLPEDAFRPLANAAALALDAASHLQRLATNPTQADEADAQMAAFLGAAGAEGTVAWGMMLVLALQNMPRAEATRQAMTPRQDPVWHGAAQGATRAAWRWIESPAGAEDDPADQLRRRIDLLDLLASDPAQHTRGLALRAKLRVSTLQLLARAVKEQVMVPLNTLATTSKDHAGTIKYVAEAARTWRRYDEVARRLEGAARLDNVWLDAAEAIRRCAALQGAERELLIGMCAPSAA